MACRDLYTSEVWNSLTCYAERKSFLYRIVVIVVCVISCYNMFKFSTWNVRGLTKDHKRSLLGQDCLRYGLDVVCVQETKCTKPEELVLETKHKLIIIDQKHCRHGGLGFVISSRITPYVKTYKYVSDRVAVLDLEIPNKSTGAVRYRIVNAYGPTTPRASNNPNLVRDFYRALNCAINVPARYELIIMGDFNAKVGKLTYEELQTEIINHVGRYGVGIRNSNGERFLEFVVKNDLFVCNTAFQHMSKHITTRTGWVKDYSVQRNGVTKPVYTQIDFIVCRRRSKIVLQDCRSYAGATLSSDHKIVLAKVDLGRPYLVHKNKPKRTHYNVSRLTADRGLQDNYKQRLDADIDSSEYTHSEDPSSKFITLMNTIKCTAKDVVGICKPTQRSNHSDDSVVVELVAKRKALRLQLNNNSSADRTELRSKINRIQKDIQKRLKTLKGEAADRLVSTIASTGESRRMFEAVRILTNSKPSRPITVHDERGHTIATDSDKAEVVKNWFEQHFTGDEPPLDPFDGIPRSLDTPITPSEVSYAIIKLKNNRSCGPDDIPNELLKYAGSSFCREFSDIINQCFETNTYIKEIGESILTPLQKPLKPRGPVKSLRPLNLLNGIRKILSVLTLNRIQEQVNQYTGPWQCGYKPGHSCADIVWSQQMLISVVLRKRCEIHKMGIDMTSAFDTIKRSTVLRLLYDAGCSDDDVRLVRLLLANTTVTVRVNGATSTVFISTVGAFQGDSLSGCIFTLSLAGGLNQLRVVYVERPIIPVEDSGMPLEWQYADDGDFIDNDLDTLTAMLPVCTGIFEEWNLHVNEAKTEFVHFYLASRGDVDSDGNLLVDNEAWRASKSLGSLLCSTRDIMHRIVLAHSAFQTYSKVWLQGSKISLRRKLLVYEAQVVSVLLYNCGCWSAPKHVLFKLDVCHRTHLRRICNISWPGVISNEELYRRCNAIPITERVRKARWTLLGHVLRMDDNCPAVLALRYAITSADLYKGRVGRPRVNLFNTIQNDLKVHNKYLKTVDDFDEIRVLAHDRVLWRNMFR